MNTESATIFTELDKLTSDTNIDFTMPEIGTEIIDKTSDYEIEEFKE